MPRESRAYLRDILEASHAIIRNTAGLTYEEFGEDTNRVKAVLYDLAVIGEAARNMPDDVRQTYSEVGWRRIVGLRNVIAHEYFGVDMLIIWDVVKNHVPELHGQIQRILDALG